MSKSFRHSAAYITKAAFIAALYVALTELSAQFGLSGTNVIQFRISEALTILPFFTSAAIPGLVIGCLLSNILTGAVVWDVVFGTVATLIGALLTYALRRYKWLAPVPPILANTIIVPFVLRYAYGFGDAWWFLGLTVFSNVLRFLCLVRGTRLVGIGGYLVLGDGKRVLPILHQRRQLVTAHLQQLGQLLFCHFRRHGVGSTVFTH